MRRALLLILTLATPAFSTVSHADNDTARIKADKADEAAKRQDIKTEKKQRNRDANRAAADLKAHDNKDARAEEKAAAQENKDIKADREDIKADRKDARAARHERAGKDATR